MAKSKFHIWFEFRGDSEQMTFFQTLSTNEKMALDFFMKLCFDQFEKNIIKFRKKKGENLCPN